MFMALFESKDARLARERVAVQMGRNSVKEYVNNCRSVSQRYVTMAKKALRLGQRRQAEQYVATHLQYENQANKWDSFILKIDDIVRHGAIQRTVQGFRQRLAQGGGVGLHAPEERRAALNAEEQLVTEIFCTRSRRLFSSDRHEASSPVSRCCAPSRSYSDTISRERNNSVTSARISSVSVATQNSSVCLATLSSRASLKFTACSSLVVSVRFAGTAPPKPPQRQRQRPLTPHQQS